MNGHFRRRPAFAAAVVYFALGAPAWLCLPALCAPTGAAAAEADSDGPLVAAATRPTVVVEARKESPLAVVEPFTPTTIVDATQIDRTPGADRTNSLAMITDFVPGAYIVHDQLHLRGGHQVTWAIDGVEIPNTSIGSNIGPQIDPKDIERLEVERGGYGAAEGDRTYGVFNVVPRTGVGQSDRAELTATGGTFGAASGYLSAASHTDRLAYYASVNGNRSALGIEPPVARIRHDAEEGYGAFTTLVLEATPVDQLRFVASARRDEYEIPSTPGETNRDVQHEADAFGILSWVRALGTNGSLTSAVFYHYNRAALDGAPGDFPISTTDQRASSYAGGQESLRFGAGRNVLEAGLYGFDEWDAQRFRVIFTDGSHPPVQQTTRPSGGLIAAYVQDTFRPAHWLTLSAGVRQTHFAGAVAENATSPRVGATVQLPRLGWMLRGFWGRYYQAPPLDTLSGPLLAYATSSNLAFLPLHGERDEEWQAGILIPVGGWMLDAGYFHTHARNFFDHNPLGDSNVFLPLTIDAAVIRGAELSVRSPELWRFARLHLAYSNQTADGFGAVSGGLTDFAPSEGGFALDHDQRNTLNVGLDARLPARAFVSLNVYCGSGFASGDPPPSHLASHVRLDVTAGMMLTERLTASLTVLNATDRRVLLDDSETFGGVHYDDPREFYAEIHYRFGY